MPSDVSNGKLQVTLATPDELPEDLVSLCAQTGMPLPPIPRDLAPRLARCPNDEHWGGDTWATYRVKTRPYFMERHVGEVTRPTCPRVLVGIDGHGMASYGWHVYLVHGSLAAFLKIGYPRIGYLSNSVFELEVAQAMLRQLITVTQQGRSEGLINRGERFLFIDSNIDQSGAKWIQTISKDSGTNRSPNGQLPDDLAFQSGGGWSLSTYRHLISILRHRRPGDQLPGVDIRPPLPLGGEASPIETFGEVNPHDALAGETSRRNRQDPDEF